MMTKLLLLAGMLIGAEALASVSLGDLLNAHRESNPPSMQTWRRPAVPAVDWSQPPLGCVEEMVPHPPTSRPCLDLTQVSNVFSDWPTNLSTADQQFWFAQRRELDYCRAEELLRREAAQPGSQSNSDIETAWLLDQAIIDYDAKVASIYQAGDTYNVPVLVLTGAVYQESLFAELGIGQDGGNYSCGPEQISLIGWCDYANSLTAKTKKIIGWPTSTVDCTDGTIVKLSLIEPFYEIALTRLGNSPEYQLQKKHYQNIALKDVVGQWPSADAATQSLRYQLIESFINNCSDPNYGIQAKAHELYLNYSYFVSNAVKQKDRYSGSARFQRQCQQTQKDNAYPLHTGWLLSVAAYNAGPRVIEDVGYYNQWSKTDFDAPAKVSAFTPDQIVSSIYWGGKYDTTTDLIDFANWSGAKLSWDWYTECVAQRHVARVMQNVTLEPTFFVDSLEGKFPCAKSVFQNGKLISSGVPPFRQSSKGTN